MSVWMLPYESIGQNWIEYSPTLEEKDKIDYLKISHIRADLIPELSEYPNLKGLNIHGVIGYVNQLDGLKELQYLTRLELTGITFDSAEYILIQISTLENLEELFLSDVKNISTLPQEVMNLNKLRSLKLEMISEELNTSDNFKLIAKIESLQTLDLQGNFWKTFQGNFDCFNEHPNLKSIRIDGNCVKDEYLRELIHDLPKIKIINKINC